MKKFFALMFTAMFLFAGCGGNSKPKTESPPTQQQQEQPKPAPTTWNKDDLNPQTNGNIAVAANLLRKNSDLNSMAIDVAPEDVMKRPWDYYGQVIRFSGTAAVLQDYPAGSDLGKILGGECCEVVLSASDASVVVIDGMLLGSTKGIREGDYVTFVGYPCGIMEVPNKLGGKFSHLVVIGKI